MKADEKQIEKIKTILGCHYDYCKSCFERSRKNCTIRKQAIAIYNADYRKQSDTVREFVQKLKAEDERCRKLYSVGAAIGFTTISKIAKEYGVGDKQ